MNNHRSRPEYGRGVFLHIRRIPLFRFILRPAAFVLMTAGLCLGAAGCGTPEDSLQRGPVTTTTMSNMLGLEDESTSSAEAASEPELAPVSEAEDRRQRMFAEEVWADTDLSEYVDPVYNLHFFLPPDIGVSIAGGMLIHGAGSTVSIISDSYGIDDEFLFATIYRASDSSEHEELTGDYREVDEDKGGTYLLMFPPSYDSSVSSEMRKFVSDNADKIVKTAYIPEAALASEQ